MFVCAATMSSVPGTNQLRLKSEKQQGEEKRSSGGNFLPIMLSVWQSRTCTVSFSRQSVNREQNMCDVSFLTVDLDSHLQTVHDLFTIACRGTDVLAIQCDR